MAAGPGLSGDVGPASGIPGFSVGGWDIYLGDIGNISSYGLPNFNAFAILDSIDGWISSLDIPLGLGALSVLQSGASISPLDAPTGYYQDVTDIAPIDRRDESPNAENVVQVVDNWVDYWDLFNAGVAVQHVSQAGAPPIGATPTILPTDDDMGWISDIYYSVDEQVFGGALPGGYVAPSITQNLGGITGQVFQQAPTAPVVVTQGGAMPPTPVGGPPMQAGCDGNPYKGWVWKYHCGAFRWVKQSRRRRKQLVTNSDLKGLGALKGVLGGGKAFEVWIATHS